MSKEMSTWLKQTSFNEKDEYYTPAILVKPILQQSSILLEVKCLINSLLHCII